MSAGERVVGDARVRPGPRRRAPRRVRPHHHGSAGAPTTLATQDPYTAAFAWASRLPAGPPPEIPFLVGTSLHLPDGSALDLDLDQAGLVGTVTGGTLILAQTSSDPLRTEYQIISPDGQARTLPAESSDHYVQEALVSPDGTLFADGPDVIDLATGQVIASLPADANILIHWTSVGIVYGTDQRAALWNPLTGAATDLGPYPGKFGLGSDSFVRWRKGCSIVSTVTADGLSEKGRLCGTRLLTASNDGNTWVSQQMDVLDTQGTQHETRGTLSGFPPDAKIHPIEETDWVSPEEFLMSMSNQNGTQSVVIRCNVDTLTCTRATHVYDLPATDRAIDLPGGG
ncbi:hypothetical protein [Nocardioides sp.]|uniref:hypothetical protein n=1 Tax=Nocardioides sp. TaxID=35761 RepID=UPI0039E4EA08